MNRITLNFHKKEIEKKHQETQKSSVHIAFISAHIGSII